VREVAPEQLKEVFLNVSTGKLLVNGVEMHDISEFVLAFKDGEWSLMFQENKKYSTKGRATS
jgi:hypothetical protein